jgi:hypothetical protein
MDASRVTAVLVTRGDHEDTLQEIIASLVFGDCVVWNNAGRLKDMGAYGRWLAMFDLNGPVAYTQDDDVLVDPDVQHRLLEVHSVEWPTYTAMTSNMPSDHNAGMPLLALPGWGSIVDVDAARSAVREWQAAHPGDVATDQWNRVGCDIVIPVLMPSQMIDLGHRSYAFASGPDRTHTQPEYKELKTWYYREAALLRAALDRRAA